MNRLIKGSLLLICMAVSIISFSQNTKKDKNADKKAEIENLLNSGNYIFVAQYVIPTGGRTINLTSEYTLKVTKEKVIADLPYFGRAYVAPINPSEGGIKLTSTSFDYKIKQGKKGKWDITINPKDNNDVRQLFLTIGSEGYSSLQVFTNNRQPISFNGYLKAPKAQ